MSSGRQAFACVLRARSKPGYYPVVMSRLLAALAVLSGTWAVWLIVAGGVEFTIAGTAIKSNDPVRPLVIAIIAFAGYAALTGAERVRHQLSGWLDRLRDARLAIAVSLCVTLLGVIFAATAGIGSDGYGYVSQADLWIRRDLRVPQPGITEAPWPDPQRTFAPLGYRPVEWAGGWAFVPIYSAGLPMIMAIAKAIGGQELLFWAVPAFGGLLTWMTFGIGRRLGSARAGLIAAWLVATSPAVLLMLFQPMSDIPAAAAWTTAVFFAIGRSRRDAACAGIASALAILIRPNLLGLAAVLGAWHLVRPAVAESAQTWRERLTSAAVYGVCAAPGVLITAALYQYLYGSPLTSGYGDLGHVFSRDHILPNIRLYSGWFFETHSRLFVAGLIALALPVRAVWPWVSNRAALVLMLVCSLVVVSQYLAYLEFDSWLYLRFLLTAWPFVMLGTAGAALVACSSRRPVISLLVSAAILALGVQGVQHARTSQVFNQWQTHRRVVDFARGLARELPSGSVVYTLGHSGTLRYYGGLTTLYTDFLEPAWLDRSVTWLGSRGIPVYLVLEEHDLEPFLRRFAGQALTASLHDRLTLTYGEATGYRVYDLTANAPVTPRAMAIGDLHALRSAAPHPDAFAPQLAPRGQR